MRFIKHRVNSISELKRITDSNWGVEIDLRSNCSKPGKLHLHHDPFVIGDDFDVWLETFAAQKLRGPLILNTKEDALEEVIIDKLRQFKIENYFFLDTALPTLVKWALVKGQSKFAVRISCYESLEGAKVFSDKVQWVWVDCFGGEPLLASIIAEAQRHFKVCLVSPELQGQPLDAIKRFAGLTKYADAICTKSPQSWVV